MTNLSVKYHPKFFKDLEALSKSQLEIVHKKLKRIKENPEQFKGLKGKGKCYTIRIEHMRLVYYFDVSNLWFLILESRKIVYQEYLKRLYNMRMKLES